MSIKGGCGNDDTSRDFGHDCNWNAVTCEGRWMCNPHHLMKRSLERMQDGQADERLGKSHRWRRTLVSATNGVLVVSVMCSLIRINGEKSKMTVLPGVGRKWRRWCRDKFENKIEIVQERIGKALKMEGQKAENPGCYATAKEGEKNLEGRPGKQLRRVHLTRVQAYELTRCKWNEWDADSR